MHERMQRQEQIFNAILHFHRSHKCQQKASPVLEGRFRGNTVNPVEVDAVIDGKNLVGANVAAFDSKFLHGGIRCNDHSSNAVRTPFHKEEGPVKEWHPIYRQSCSRPSSQIGCHSFTGPSSLWKGVLTALLLWSLHRIPP